MLALFVFAACAFITRAQYPDIPAASSGEIQFYVDHASFNGTEDYQFVEFYIMLFADQLNADEDEDELKAEYAVNTIITDTHQNEVNKNSWETEAVIDDEVSSTKIIYDKWIENLLPGEYNLKINLKDKSSGRKGEAEYAFIIKKEEENIPSASQIEFVSRIETGAAENQFSKGKYSVIPNPSRRYGMLNPILYLYFEIYNLPDESDSLLIKYSAINSSGETVKNFPSAYVKVNGSSAAVVHGLNTANMPSGIYDLSAQVMELNGNKLAELRRRFEVIQMDYTELQQNFFVDEAEVFGKLLSIIGSPNEIKIYESLEQSAKPSFILQYWKNLDPTPGTPENEYLTRIQQRFIYAEKNFGWGSTPGWQTERGRILLKYGMPDEIDQHQSEPDTRPYEIWKYKQERSFIFVFADLRDNGNYVLIHSDKEGEISNLRWPDYIKLL